MMRKTPTDLPGRKSSGGALAPIGQSTSKTTHNKGYEKYEERYQYVIRFFLKNHGRTPEPLATRGTLLRNWQVMQQGCAC
jgi:hypothetical protein